MTARAFPYSTVPSAARPLTVATVTVMALCTVPLRDRRRRQAGAEGELPVAAKSRPARLGSALWGRPLGQRSRGPPASVAIALFGLHGTRVGAFEGLSCKRRRTVLC